MKSVESAEGKSIQMMFWNSKHYRRSRLTQESLRRHGGDTSVLSRSGWSVLTERLLHARCAGHWGWGNDNNLTGYAWFGHWCNRRDSQEGRPGSWVSMGSIDVCPTVGLPTTEWVSRCIIIWVCGEGPQGFLCSQCDAWREWKCDCAMTFRLVFRRFKGLLDSMHMIKLWWLDMQSETDHKKYTLTLHDTCHTMSCTTSGHDQQNNHQQVNC